MPLDARTFRALLAATLLAALLAASPAAPAQPAAPDARELEIHRNAEARRAVEAQLQARLEQERRRIKQLAADADLAQAAGHPARANAALRALQAAEGRLVAQIRPGVDPRSFEGKDSTEGVYVRDSALAQEKF